MTAPPPPVDRPTAGTIRVTLAEVPTDVLVYLVDAPGGAWKLDEITAGVTPPEIEKRTARFKVRDALDLLVTGGWVASSPRADGMHYWATCNGEDAVAAARGVSE